MGFEDLFATSASDDKLFHRDISPIGFELKKLWTLRQNCFVNLLNIMFPFFFVQLTHVSPDEGVSISINFQ